MYNLERVYSGTETPSALLLWNGFREYFVDIYYISCSLQQPVQLLLDFFLFTFYMISSDGTVRKVEYMVVSYTPNHNI